MSRYTYSKLASLQNETSALSSINADRERVKTAIDNTLSRYGDVPNAMYADLDMNGNNILNLPEPASLTEPVRLQDLIDTLAQSADYGLFPIPAISDAGKLVRVNNTALGFDYSNVVFNTTTNAITPVTNDGTGIGTGSLSFSDLFLASGAVVNFNNGDITLTHSADVLTLAGGDLRITTAGTNSASVVTVGGTQTLTNKTLTDAIVGTQTLLDASTKAASTAYVDRTTREKLTANKTYYVRTDGSDSNNGLTNTAGGAFLTVQKAVDTALAIDMSIYSTTISVGAGTFAANVVINGQGNVRLTISGAGSTSTTIGAGSGTGISLSGGCTVTLSNLAIADNQSVGIWSRFGAQLYLNGTVRLGIASARQIGTDTGTYIQSTSGTIELAGNAPYFILAGSAASVVLTSGVKIRTTAAIGYADLFYVQNTATLALGASLTWDQTAGAITARKYRCELNGLISTAGNAIPGATPGIVLTGGQVT